MMRQDPRIISPLEWLSENTDQASALASASSAVFAFAALIIAGLSIYYTHRGLSIQRRHNSLSVRPIPYIELTKGNGIIVSIENHGFGPFKILNFRLIGGEANKWNLGDYLPKERPKDVTIRTITGLHHRTISEESILKILVIEIPDINSENYLYLKSCIDNLSKMSISISYTDIYDSQFDNYVKSLEWLSKSIP